MTLTQSWGWLGPSLLPGWNPANQDNLTGNRNGMVINPGGYTEFTIQDINSDGKIFDYDLDDAQLPTPGDAIIGPTMTLYVQEIALYTNSTIVMNGQVISGLSIEMTLFTNGMYGARLMDYSIPAGHYSSVEYVQLGTWNGVEYDGINIAGVDQMFVCYLAGTLILTAEGHKRVEDIAVGDLVVTPEGPEPVRWIGSNIVLGVGENAPIRIAPQTLGNEAPLLVSPNHRILIDDYRAQLYFGEDQVFVAAKHLVDGYSITQEPQRLVNYVHFALDRHAIVEANGVLSESLLPGPEALKTVGLDDRDRLLDVFPHLSQGWDAYGPAAARCVTGREARVLARAPEVTLQRLYA